MAHQAQHTQQRKPQRVAALVLAVTLSISALHGNAQDQSSSPLRTWPTRNTENSSRGGLLQDVSANQQAPDDSLEENFWRAPDVIGSRLLADNGTGDTNDITLQLPLQGSPEDKASAEDEALAMAKTMTTAGGFLTTGLLGMVSWKLLGTIYARWYEGETLSFRRQFDGNPLTRTGREFMRKSLILSTRNSADGTSQMLRQILASNSVPGDELLANLTASALGGLVFMAAQRAATAPPASQDWNSVIGFSHAVISQGFLMEALSNLNNILVDLTLGTTDSQQQAEKRTILGRVTSLLESGLILSLLTQNINAAANAEDNNLTWMQAFLLRPATIGLFQQMKGLVSTLAARTYGNKAERHLVTSGLLASAALPMHYLRGPVTDTGQASLGSLLTDLTTENTGVNLGVGLAQLLDESLQGENPNLAYSTAVRMGLTLGAALTLQAASQLAEGMTGGSYLKPVLRSLGYGFTTASVAEFLRGVRQLLIEPWVMQPLMDQGGGLLKASTEDSVESGVSVRGTEQKQPVSEDGMTYARRHYVPAQTASLTASQSALSLPGVGSDDEEQLPRTILLSPAQAAFSQ
ncbi:MAG: hypothetical protein OXC07_12995 [Kistimonas sp.]|nr:hypothetical protein [Kistimonas sp.]